MPWTQCHRSLAINDKHTSAWIKDCSEDFPGMTYIIRLETDGHVGCRPVMENAQKRL